MASEQAAVSSVSAPVLLPTLSEAAKLSTNPPEVDPGSRLLKRSRLGDDPSTTTQFPKISTERLSPSPKSPRFYGAFSAAPLTGAAAIEEQQRKESAAKYSVGAMSENPGHRALSTLGGTGMSKPQDVPVTSTAMSEGMSIAASALTLPTQALDIDRTDTSQEGVSSLANIGDMTQTVTASPTFVSSPGQINGLSDTESRNGGPNASNSLRAPIEDQSNRALSFPGNMMPQSSVSRAPPRGLSLPMPGQSQNIAPRSPSQKKHKCPYCETEFTRHHNLKSHLLTHSQEKPYVCQTCNMRFRRLHDLKRHTKLHTGERPHVCPKCDRKFARGDALARHAKGQGGCAGRRASMGSFGGDDDYQGSNAGDDEEMDGVSYTNGTPRVNEASMTEEERRRASLPSINAQHVSGHHGSQDNYRSHSRNPSTYPPAGPRSGQATGGLYPPSAERGSSSSGGMSTNMQNSYASHNNQNSSISSMGLSTGGSSSVYAQSTMTESPKPLSPAGMHSHQLGHDQPPISRQRSPSLSTQFQQHHFGRRQTGRDSPTGMSLPSPHDRSQGPKLPAIAGLAPPDGRFTLNSQAPTPQMQNGGQQAQQTQSTATSPSATFQPPRSAVTAHPGTGSGDSSKNLFASGEQGVWSYVQTLEEQAKDMQGRYNALQSRESAAQDQIKRQQDLIKTLTEETVYLRGQLGIQAQSRTNEMT